MSKIPRRGSKVPVYKVGILTMCNIDCRRNDMEVSDICDLLIFHKVRH